MRRWHRPSRLRSAPDRPDSVRCVLVVEELERREVLSPVVTPPNSGATVPTEENSPYTFSASTSFFASDLANSGQNYRADLTATNGTITVDPTAAQSLGLAVTNDGTADVSVVGTLDNIDSLLVGSGVTFQPDAYYSGDAAVSVTVTDLLLGGPPGTGTVPIHVLPVADDANLIGPAEGQVDAPSSGFVFPPGFVAVTQWPNATGSETVTVSFSLDADNPNGTNGFTLSAGGVPVAQIEPGYWQVSGTSEAGLNALLDSLVLTPPAGYTGPVDLSGSGYINNVASYSDGTTATSGQSIGEIDIPLRFFVGGSVTTPTTVGVEGGVLDLGGRYVVSDPDETEGDAHTLALSVPSGTLTFDASDVPAGSGTGSINLTATSTVGSGGTTIVLTGTVAEINQFLATPGSLTYSADSPYFAGVVPLTLTLENHAPDPFSEILPYQYGGSLPPPAPGAFTGVAALGFAPVADAAFPSAVDVQTNQDTPVPLTIDVSALPPDPTESVLVVVSGVPAGATLNNGTDLGGGQWALAPSDLTGLVFAPPPGASGAFTLVVQAAVTDSAPALGLVDTKSESTTFTVTVIPAPAAPPTPPVPPTPAAPPSAPTQLSVPITAAVVGALVEDLSGTTGTIANTGTTTASETNTGNSDLNPVVVTFAAYSAGANAANPTASAEVRVSSSQSTPGSLFSQVEVPLPTYASGGERHPLPPVLPLDQTLPVAGFSDSGGDCFALIDKLYRDAAAERFSATQMGAAPVVPAPAVAPAAVAATAERPVPAPVAVAAQESRTDDSGAPLPLPAADAPAGYGRAAAAFALAALVAACGWRVRGPVSAAATGGVRWLFRTLHRRPIERTV